MGLTYKVNSVVFFVSSCPIAAMNQVKKHDKSTGNSEKGKTEDETEQIH